ncbi:hypothetical protein HanXRQr2_Chr16g0763661 [Helianthus annuus]|uniref:Uncharacterized protein n=1 Tax=Helianthus annuus TaxID=4232 RepID=A0A9K3DTG2_HELAN|nr:uncharacterized protein LOC110928625 [Helianthus annuus]KAF5761317.1 hypothetical protein HanXRQr2_Chr16g0763661 [Helianthus annuus]KAJ0444225.1 hypothetical protein HanIR_Chr16g0829441 [Helianthus annuus]KAJ0822420.1 hypothetical protein HanPSC8_Chr16g0731791 [Helianthus annuus]
MMYFSLGSTFPLHSLSSLSQLTSHQSLSLCGDSRSRSGSRVSLLSLSRSKLFRSAFPSRLKRWTKIEAARARVVTRLRLTPARIPKSGEAPASSPVTDETSSISKAAFGLLVSGPSGQMTWIRGGPTSLDIRNIKEAIDEWKRWW